MTPPPKKWERRVRLSPEQAMRLAKEQLAPDWHLSKPLAMPVPAAGGAIALAALDPGFNEGYWVIFLLDPSEFGALDWLRFLGAIAKRYSNLNVRVLAIFESKSKALLDGASVRALIERFSGKFPIHCDRSGYWKKALGLDGESTGAAILHQGKPVAALKGHEIARIELIMPPLLRKEDPGLPLWAPFTISHMIPNHAQGIEFGTRTGQASGFSGSGAAVSWEGNWKIEEECLSPQDANCKLIVKTTQPILAIVARSLIAIATFASVAVSLDGNFFDESIRDEDVDHDPDGNPRVNIKDAALYRIGRKVPAGATVVFSFPHPKNQPVGVIALRFGSD